MAMSQLEALVCPGLANIIDLGRVLDLQYLRHPVDTLPLVLPNPNPDKTPGDDPTEVRKMDPLLQLVPAKSHVLRIMTNEMHISSTLTNERQV